MNRAYIISLLSIVLLLGGSRESLFAQRGRVVVDISELASSSNVTSVFISSTMLKNSGLDFKDFKVPSFQYIFQSTESIRVLISENEDGIKELKKFVAPLTDTRSKQFECLFSVMSEGTLINLVGQKERKSYSPLYLMIDDADEQVVIIFDGVFSQEQVERLLDEGEKGTDERGTKSNRRRRDK